MPFRFKGFSAKDPHRTVSGALIETVRTQIQNQLQELEKVAEEALLALCSATFAGIGRTFCWIQVDH